MADIRTFESGATRDTDKGKLDYEGFLSPQVLKRFAEYMHKNRVQSDGSYRDSDNWQKLFGENHYDVCMKSAWRHFHDMWLIHRGESAREDMESAINGLLFNVMAYQFKRLQDEQSLVQLANEQKM